MCEILIHLYHNERAFFDNFRLMDMLVLESMPSRIKKEEKVRKSEGNYDGFVFAIEIVVTIALLIIIYLISNLS